MKKSDFILMGIVVLLGIGILVFINLNKTSGTKVKISIDGREVKTFDLKEDITYTIDEDGKKNILTIKDGYVDMIDANCPDKLCVKHKNIHYNGETIVCLPHKVVIEIAGGEKNPVDAIAN